MATRTSRAHTEAVFESEEAMNEDCMKEKIQYLDIEIGGYARLLPRNQPADAGSGIVRTLLALKQQRDKLLGELEMCRALPVEF